MGREIERVLLERGHEVVLKIDAENRADLCPARLRGIDAALEFTTPATAYDNLRACIDAGVQVDYFPYPTHEHNVMGKDRVHLMQKVTDYFEDYLR